MISVVANVNLTKKEGKIKFVNALKSGVRTGPGQGDMILIRIKEGEAQTLREYPAQVRLSSELCPTDDRTGIVSAVIPASPDVRSIELVVDGKVVDTFAIGTVFRAAGEPEVREETDRTFYVQISSDYGQTWQTRHRPEDALLYIRSQPVPGRGAIQVRIVATDGLANSLVSEEFVPITCPNRLAPQCDGVDY